LQPAAEAHADRVPHPLAAELARGPLVMDSAMGTRLLHRGLDLRFDDPCLWNLSHPLEVLDIHRRDVQAGAQVLVTNTFGANRSWLASDRFGLQGGRPARAIREINRRAVDLAREAAGRGRFVAGCIGPTAALEAGAAAEQAEILLDAGVDALLLETYRAPAAARVLHEVRARTGSRALCLASLWEWPEPTDAPAAQLLALGADVLGMNCQIGIDRALAFADRLGREIRCPILVKPGASPTDPRSDPAAFAAAVPALLARGVRLLGGCCGTTEHHVAAFAAACARPVPKRPKDTSGATP
jgi:methionine synthase I (cobalamin-dependent)